MITMVRLSNVCTKNWVQTIKTTSKMIYRRISAKKVGKRI